MKRALIYAALIVPAVLLADLRDTWALRTYTIIFHVYLAGLVFGATKADHLRRRYKVSMTRGAILLIAGTYASAWVWVFGLTSDGFIVNAFWRPTIENVVAFNVSMAVVTYLASLLVEFPFVALCLRGRPDGLRESARVTFWMVSVVHALLLAAYAATSHWSELLDTKVAPVADMSLAEAVEVYFISDQGGLVNNGSLGGSLDRIEWTEAFELDESTLDDRLAFRPSRDDDESVELVAYSSALMSEGPGGVPRWDPILLADGIARSATAPDPLDESHWWYEGSWLRFGLVPRLGTQNRTDSWEFETGEPGFELAGGSSDRKVRFGVQTPFAQWPVHNATQLPDDKVLLQLGWDQICLYDPEKQRIAVLARGRGPAAHL